MSGTSPDFQHPPIRIHLPLAGNQTDTQPCRPLHRLAEVRRQEHVSRRSVARQLHVDLGTVQKQESESSDLLLSTLYQWRDVLKVPLVELLVDSDNTLSPPIMKRAHMVLLMKTANAILERARHGAVRILAQRLVDELTALMPELRGVAAWNVVGHRRRRNDYGVAAFRRFLTQFPHESDEC